MTIKCICKLKRRKIKENVKNFQCSVNVSVFMPGYEPLCELLCGLGHTWLGSTPNRSHRREIMHGPWEPLNSKQGIGTRWWLITLFSKYPSISPPQNSNFFQIHPISSIISSLFGTFWNIKGRLVSQERMVRVCKISFERLVNFQEKEGFYN